MGVNQETAFDNFREITPVSPPSAASGGGGGGSMYSWGLDRQAILGNLIVTTYNDGSSYGLPAGVVDGNASFDNSFPDTERKMVEDSGGRLGGGDDVMDSWEGTDQELVDNLLVGTFNNASSFAIPSVVVEGVDFDTFVEQGHGVSEPGVEVGYTYLGTKISGVVDVAEAAGVDSANSFTASGVELETTDGTNVFTAQADDATGEYRLPVSVGGTYRVIASHPVLSRTSKVVELAEGESKPDVNLTLGAGNEAGLKVGNGGAEVG